ncbi:hypothetical protein KX928_17495 [Roseobacter sp. YSTF-M11]|uniref:Lipoprotein n=1 Tax=Roseobacter insulae TaxID=2859783 RepID=A0A9X1FXG8_9RHOB|nr:hypothetical protein [Roseobacter insulae]MBW4709584.1 hypothetical protein [Roseobacter insulae]
MRTLAAAILPLILIGCATEAPLNARAALDRLQDLATPHAAALAGEDVNEMRRTGRDLIASIDAAAGPQ